MHLMAIMRITLTLDDDLAGLLKQRVRELGVPLKEVVYRAIRTGLGDAAQARPLAAPKVIPHSFGFRRGVDLDKLGQLADELEAEAYARSQSASGRGARRGRRGFPVRPAVCRE